LTKCPHLIGRFKNSSALIGGKIDGALLLLLKETGLFLMMICDNYYDYYNSERGVCCMGEVLGTL